MARRLKKMRNAILDYNKDYFSDVLSELLQTPNVVPIGGDYIAVGANKTDQKEPVIVMNKEAKTFEVVKENILEISIGVYTPFDFITELKYRGNARHALNYILHDVFGADVEYLRIGIKYFKFIEKKDSDGQYIEDLEPWNKETLMTDYPRDYLYKIPQYDTFTVEPSNKEFERRIGENYNRYKPFIHREAKTFTEKDIKWSMQLMKHIFGTGERTIQVMNKETEEMEDKVVSELELGLRYMKILYDHPKQKLPILVLVSEERQTGKTTFVNWMRSLFGENAVIVNPKDMARDFNSSYAYSNLIMIEESRFDNQQTLEKLKNLATQKTILVNSKFIPEHSVPFYGKLIITSNDESKFSRVDDKEIRYWVRKVPTLKGKGNHSILDDLVDEIPAFLAMLSSLPAVNRSNSRMVFITEEIETDALKTVKEESRSELHKVILMKLEEHFVNNDLIEKVDFTPINMKEQWFQDYRQWSPPYIEKVLRDEIKLKRITKKGQKKRYIPFEDDSNFSMPKEKKGVALYRVYKKELLVSLEEDRENIPDEVLDPNDVPF